MEYRRVEDYQYRPETLKILYAIRVHDVVRMRNSIREGDYISYPVMKLSYSPEQEMAVNRRLRVLRKYPYIMELWDAVAKKSGISVTRTICYSGCEGERMRKIKCELYNDSFQNWKKYPIQKAQLVIADVPYALGNMAYGSNPMWYNGGDNTNGESKLAGKAFFPSDMNFNLYEFFHFCNQLLKKEPKKSNGRGVSSDAPCMILFCRFEQFPTLIAAAEKHGFVNHIPLVFIKNYSAQVLKANMRIVGATEYGMVLYRDRLPKFRNEGKMVFNWMSWERDGAEIPKCHPTQKPQGILRRLIEIFTDPGDVVIDPVAGSGSTLRAAKDLGRNSYGFEIYKPFYRRAVDEMLNENYGEYAMRRADQETGQMNIYDCMEGNVG